MAAFDELAEVGYAALTMERVAARARTSKAALYRRWTGRAELALDAWQARGLSDVELPDTGTLRGDMLALLRQVSAKMDSPIGGIMRGLLVDLTRDPEFARLIRERIHTTGPVAVRTILRRAVERGEVEEWVPVSRRAGVATDLLRNEFLLFGAPVEDETIIEIIDDVYLPLVLAPAPRPTPRSGHPREER
ncbi:TetR/AcrR family transcriptional regulator [Streptomyces paromomycinus]|uniref:TetR family transcriptional regulator n=1 Tax=Streptomyces paromomycinus TaxID=92743 RepID=A0A401VUJ8_STREY|nr:TetR/AcrR family transcriptional regulator [Streptomyces paromomycinus]GCD40750.1 TetR family transcriptional regulator [Streptomyces paromomycinus]